MGIADAMNVQKSWRNQRASAGAGCWRSFTQQLDFQAAFFPGLTQSRLLRIFIQLNVPAQRQPLIQLPMVNEQDLAGMHHEDRHRKIYFLMDMSHSLPVWQCRRQSPIGNFNHTPGGEHLNSTADNAYADATDQ